VFDDEIAVETVEVEILFGGACFNEFLCVVAEVYIGVVISLEVVCLLLLLVDPPLVVVKIFDSQTFGAH